MWTWIELASRAWAGACCVGSSGAVPARLDDCEKVLVGAAVGGESAFARWDAAGAVVAASPRETGASATALVAARATPWLQGSVSLPTRWSSRTAGELSDQGGGLGDMGVGVTLEPFDEVARAEGRSPLPVPLVSFGLRLPTGRDWTEAAGPLLADVTGLPGVGASARLGVERATGAFPAWLAADAGADPGVPLRVGGSAGLGHAVAGAVVLVGSVSHQAQLSQGGVRRTRAGLRLLAGRRSAWRSWVGVDVDVPIPGIGRSNAAAANLDAGLAWIR